MKTRQHTRNVNIKPLLTALLLLTAALLSCSQAIAMGVGPSRQYVSFDPGGKIENKLLIINDQKQDFKAVVYAQGDLSNYIEIDQPLIDVSSNDYLKEVEYKLEFPKTPPSPGPHKIELVVRQLPSDAEGDEGTVVSANTALISEIIVQVPYPGSFAEGKLFVSGTQDPSSPSTFTVMLYNYGTDEIKEAHARVEIQGPLLGKIAEFNTKTISVKSKEEGKLEATWQPSVTKGTYKAVVTVYYDDKQFKLEQNFDLGTFSIDITDISVKKFTLGDVAKFDILLTNNWNTQIDGVYNEITVSDSTGKQMTEFKTAAQDIPAGQTGQFEGFWYTEGAMPGVYKVTLRVHYSGKITQKEYDFEVNTNSFKQLGAVGQAVTPETGEEDKQQNILITLILIVIAVLLLMNFIWFYFLAKQFRKGNDEKKGGGK